MRSGQAAAQAGLDLEAVAPSFLREASPSNVVTLTPLLFVT